MPSSLENMRPEDAHFTYLVFDVMSASGQVKLSQEFIDFFQGECAVLVLITSLFPMYTEDNTGRMERFRFMAQMVNRKRQLDDLTLRLAKFLGESGFCLGSCYAAELSLKNNMQEEHNEIN